MDVQSDFLTTLLMPVATFVFCSCPTPLGLRELGQVVKPTGRISCGTLRIDLIIGP
jgi:hypothetical protein